MPNIGPMELIILLVILLLIFGPKRLPGLGKQLGGGIKDFKEAVTAKHDADDDEDPPVKTLPPAPRADTDTTAAADPSGGTSSASVAKSSGLDG